MKVKIHKTEENYFINEDAKAIACVVELTLENEGKYFPFKASGKAKCSKHDTYDEKVGKRIAYTRAKIKALADMKRCLKEALKEAKSIYESVEANTSKVQGCINAETESLKRLLK